MHVAVECLRSNLRSTHVGKRPLHEFTKQHGCVASRAQCESESNTGAFRVPTVPFTWPRFPTLAQRAAFSDGHGINGEFFEFGHECSTRTFGGQAGHGLNVPRDVSQPLAVDGGLFELPGMAVTGGNLTARERSGGGESAKVAVSSNAVERALLDDNARIDVQLAFLVDAADDIANDRS